MWASEPDRGQSDALNKALSKAPGSWIGWLNADEFYFSGSLAMLVEHGERMAADIVYGDCVFVDADGNVQRLLPQLASTPASFESTGASSRATRSSSVDRSWERLHGIRL